MKATLENGSRCTDLTIRVGPGESAEQRLMIKLWRKYLAELNTFFLTFGGDVRLILSSSRLELFARV